MNIFNILIILVFIILNMLTLHKYKYKHNPPIWFEYLGGILVIIVVCLIPIMIFKEVL